MRKGAALIVGVTGISGYNLANVLLADGWTVYGLARRPLSHEGVIPVAADLLDAEATKLRCRGYRSRTCSSAPGRAAIPSARTSKPTAR